MPRPPPAGTRGGARTNAILGGIAGTLAGCATCALAGALDMLPTLALPLGSQSAALGACVHLVVSAALGAVFAVYMGVATRLRDLVTAGILYGAIWWLAVPMLLIPAWFSQDTNLVVVQFAVLSMAGQAIYGPITGALVYALRCAGRRTTR